MDLSELAPLDEANVTRNVDGSVTLKLTDPLLGGNEPVSALTLRRPKAKDLEWFETVKNGEGGIRQLVARLGAVEPVLLLDLDAYDFGQTNALVASFLLKPRPVGAGHRALQRAAGTGGDVQIHFKANTHHANGGKDTGLVVEDELAVKQVENFAICGQRSSADPCINQ